MRLFTNIFLMCTLDTMTDDESNFKAIRGDTRLLMLRFS